MSRLQGDIIMNDRLKKLLEKEKLTSEEYDEVAEMEEVSSIDNNGISGHYIGWIWYTIYLANGEESDVYLKD